jgi:hypothetical protein
VIRYIVKSLHRGSDKIRISILELRFSILGQLRTGRRLNPRANQLIVLGHAVKTLESKETRASKKITVTHNSVFAAHRLQCRMTIRKIDIRHFVFESIEATAFYRPVRAASTKRSDYSVRRSINGET